jgi:pimeloyl-ACP methyl ester carboxylesterase
MSEISPALYRAGEGEPVVLLHGFTGMWRHWRPVLGDLVARYEVIAPTLSGHDGGPPFPAGLPMTMAGAADSLERHLDDLGVGTAHVVGNSMGGSLAIELAKRGRARSVVAISPGGGWELEAHEREGKRIARFFARQDRLMKAAGSRLPLVMRRPRSRQLALRDVMRRGFLVPPVDAVEMAEASMRCEVFDIVLAAIHSGEVLPVDLDQVNAPVLLAWAQHDRILPLATCSSRFRRDIPGAEFRVLPRVGHVPMWDDTHLVVDTIVDWVDKHSRVATPPLASAASAD